MIEIDKSPEWDEVEDRVLLAQFLNTRTGQRLLPKVAESAPRLLSGGPVNEILIRSGEVIGFSKAVQSLISLATIEPQTPTQEVVNTAYPRLDDDDKWNDGQKVKNSEKTP